MKGFSRRWMSANAKEMKVVNDEREKKNDIYSRRQRQSICSNVNF